MSKPSNGRSATDQHDELDSHIYVSMAELSRLQFQARGFSFLPNQPATSALSGKNVSKLRGRGLNFEELRHYRPGDDIRAMDWKVTQRTGKPHIKVFTEERERNVYLAIDQRVSMFFGSTHKMKSVIASEIAALIAWQVTGSGDRVGAMVYNDDSIKTIPAKRGKQHVINVLNEVIKKNHQLKVSSKVPEHADIFNTMLSKLKQVIGHNALVILIGDGHGWDDKSTGLIKQIRQQNEVIACRIFDPLETDLPNMTQMVVSDGHQQIQFSSKDKNTQEKYRNNIEQQLAHYQQIAKQYRIPFISIDTINSVSHQLQKALGKVG